VSDQESQQLLVPFEADIVAIAISADGKRVTAGGHFDFLLVWNVTTGKLIRELPAPGWSVTGSQLQVGLSPDGKLLAALDSHPTIRLWDVETREERRPLSLKGSRFSVFDFSRDGSVLACGDLSGQISLWDARSGEFLRCFNVRPNTASGVRPPPKSDKLRRDIDGIVSLAISSDGKRIACSCEGALYLWDSAGQVGKRLPQVSLGTNQIALAFSPDNQFLVGCDNTSQIKVWNVATGRCILPDSAVDSDRDNDPSCFAAISPDDSMVATFSARRIRFWDVRSGRQLGEIPAGDVEGRGSKPIAFSADGKYLLRPYHAVKVADVLTGEVNRDTAWTAYPWARAPKTILQPQYGGKFNDSRLVRRVAAGSVPNPPRPGALRPIALSPDEKTVAWGRLEMGSNRPSVLVLSDWKSAQVVGRVSCPGPWRSATFSPDGKSLAVAGEPESYVGLWDVSSGNRICELAKVSSEPFSGFAWGYRPLAFSPDGRFLAAGDADCNIRVWNAATDKTAAVLKGHGGPILSLAFFADGRRLLSGSTDSTALIWDVSRPVSPTRQRGECASRAGASG
jgi:WD40 repeat protein